MTNIRLGAVLSLVVLNAAGLAGCNNKDRSSQPAPATSGGPAPEASEQVAQPSVAVDVQKNAGDGYEFGTGWAHAEKSSDGSHFRWNNGAVSEMKLNIAPAPEGNIIAFTGTLISGQPQTISVAINDTPIGTLSSLAEGSQLFIPPGVLVRGKNELTLSYAWTQKPSVANPTSKDSRDLAANFKHIDILPLPAHAAVHPGLAVSKPLLQGGWQADEVVEGRSVASGAGPVSMKAFMKPEGAAYWVRVSAASAKGKGELKVRINGKDAGKVQVSPTWSRDLISIPAGVLVAGANVVELSAAVPKLLVDGVELLPEASDVEVDVSKPGATRSFLEAGWSSRENAGDRYFAWSNGSSSKLSFPIAAASTPYRLRILATAAGPLKATVFLAGKEVGAVDFEGRGEAEKTLDLPKGTVPSGEVPVELRYSKTFRPNSHDTRDLGLALRRVILAPVK